MVFHILFSIACIIAAIMITAVIVRNNRDMYDKTPLGWWLVGIGISQICIVAALAVWYKNWWITHQWIMNISSGITIAAVVLWIVAKIYGSRH